MEIINVRPIQKDGLIHFKIDRDNLENLVMQSKRIRTKTQSSTHPKLKPFYENDFHALRRLQHQFKFLLIYPIDFNDKEINFHGEELEDNKLNKKYVLLHINGLSEHLTCVRFAYAAYELTKRNFKIHSQIRKAYPDPSKETLELFFKRKLGDYLLK